MAEPYIKIDNITFSYQEEGTEKKPTVLKNFSLNIEKGSFVALLGHNGSGKSTLAKLICAILIPEKGKIFVGNTEVSSPDLNDEELLELHRRVGMVFQNPDNQLVATVVEEDIAFGPENLGVEPAEIRRRVDEVMAKMELTDYAGHSPSKLSGGQKQRVAVAGLLAMQPECMIFDEATAMLDPQGRKEVMNTILRLNKEMGITVIHITHNMDEAVLADRVVVMDDGDMVLDGAPEFVFAQVETMRKIGLEVLQGTELLYELHKLLPTLPDGLTDSNACADAIFEYYRKMNKDE